MAGAITGALALHGLVAAVLLVLAEAQSGAIDEAAVSVFIDPDAPAVATVTESAASAAPAPQPDPPQPEAAAAPPQPQLQKAIPLPEPMESLAPSHFSRPPPPVPGWNALLAAWLAAHRRYPEEAHRRSEEGDVTIRFTVASDGRVSDVVVVKGSGFAAFDKSALGMLQGATVSAPGVEATRTVRIRFRLSN